MITSRVSKLLNEENYDWSAPVICKVGAFLVGALIQTSKRPSSSSSSSDDDAFIYEKRRLGMKKVSGYVRMNSSLHDDFMSSISDDVCGPGAIHGTSARRLSNPLMHARHLPMVVPPNSWELQGESGDGKGTGCCYFNAVKIMRTKDKVQDVAISRARRGGGGKGGDTMKVCREALDALGLTPWRINSDILALQLAAWERGLEVGGMPSRVDVEVPDDPGMARDMVWYGDAPIGDDGSWDEGHVDYKGWREKYDNHARRRQGYLSARRRRNELHSLRCDAIIKLNQARDFESYERIYFGWNLDFRGRAYPVPANLNHMGSDISRGLLMSAESRRLGSRGLMWLKVNMANLYGMDKVSMDERVRFVDEHMEEIRSSVDDPFENLWWDEADNPWQFLACCMELVKALDSPNPPDYSTRLFVSMDGSCNGLQHYAALGRDKEGGQAVNLTPSDVPMDVYTGVLKKVKEKVNELSSSPAPPPIGSDGAAGETKKDKKLREQRECAIAVKDMVDRKVVKQTVMTSVYGVTYIGAREQVGSFVRSFSCLLYCYFIFFLFFFFFFFFFGKRGP